MKKAQTQTSRIKQELSTNMGNVKLTAQINALKAELTKKTKQYNDDILEFNLKVNNLDLIIEKKDAEYSTEVIKHLSKISDLENKIRHREEEDEKMNEELIYRANKLNEYEAKIKELNFIINNSVYPGNRESVKIEEQYLFLQQTMESKFDETIKYLGHILTTMRIIENKKNNTENISRPTMDSLIKLLQKSDEQCGILQGQNSELKQQNNSAVKETNAIKSILYENILSRYNFQLYIVKLYEAAVNGLIIDLKTVLPRLTNDTRPSVSECVLQLQSLTMEFVQYSEMLRELESYRLYIDEAFAGNNINSNINTFPEFKGFRIPVSILHIKYIPMLDALRQQNNINLFQMQTRFSQEFKGFPLNYPYPYGNNVPQILNIPTDVRCIKSENSVTVEDVTNQNTKPMSIQELTVSNSNLTHTEDLVTLEEDLTCQENEDLTKIIVKTEGKDYSKSVENDKEVASPKLTFKLTSKAKEFLPSIGNVFAKHNSPKNSMLDTKSNTDIQSSSDEESKTPPDTSLTYLLSEKYISDHIKDTYQNHTDLIQSEAIINDSKDTVNHQLTQIDIKTSLQRDIKDNLAVVTQNDLKNDLPPLAQINLNNDLPPLVQINLNNDLNLLGQIYLNNDAPLLVQINKIDVKNGLPLVAQINNDLKTNLPLTHVTSDTTLINETCSSKNTLDGVDANIVEKFGGSSSLISLYVYVKDKAKVVDMINVSDDELVNAILTVKQETTLKGMRKKDILTLVLADVKKQKGFVESSNINKFCAICFDSNDEPLKTLPCQHAFHTDCLERWFQRDNICPICRKLVVTVDDLTLIGNTNL